MIFQKKNPYKIRDNFFLVAPARFELAMMESESIALPLGHGALTIKIITYFFNKKKIFCNLNLLSKSLKLTKKSNNLINIIITY